VNNFFFSDMDERVLERHIQELKDGHFIRIQQQSQ
jgi:hypothetical protein